LDGVIWLMKKYEGNLFNGKHKEGKMGIKEARSESK